MTRRTRTVGVSFERLVPDERHKAVFHDAVHRTHRATILATELLNLYVRHRLEYYDGTGLDKICDANWLMNVYYEVTHGKRKSVVLPELREVREKHMTFEPVDRAGLTQVLGYECRNLAAVASNNVWMHFRRRLLCHVKHHFAIPAEDFKSLSKEERRSKRLAVMQIADDVARNPSFEGRSPNEHHEWVKQERERLGIDDAVRTWSDKPLDYYLKVHPERFVKTMHTMASDREAKGMSSFSLFPLRRSMVPKHIRIDQEALRSLLSLGRSEYAKNVDKRQRLDNGKRARRPKADTVDEKAEAFRQVIDLRACKLRQRERFDWAFTTDGVCARLQCYVPTKTSTTTSNAIPTRGRFEIDELKRVTRWDAAHMHVVGIDPGIKELLVAVDEDDPKSCTRYTQRQRLRDIRSRQYADCARRSRPIVVVLAEEELSAFNSHTSSLQGFKSYCVQRHKTMKVMLDHYSGIDYRKRRWKTYIKTQQSEERLYKRLRSMHSDKDTRTLVLAYGSWGAVAGKSSICKKGNPPCINTGLLNKLSKRFVVAVTPEQYTSKTCCRCLHPCGPWMELETKMGRSIRGVRVCQNEECRIPLNRDRNAALNIGTQFRRIYDGICPIRELSGEEDEFQRLNSALHCGDCE